MPARIGHLELVHLVDLLARLHLQGQRFAVFRQQAAGALVDRERRIDQLATVLQNVIDAVDAVRGLLAAGQRHDQVATRPEIAFLPEPDHQVEKHGGHGLVVGGAAAVEEAVLFDERERIALPVLASRVDHVDVREQQHGLSLRFLRPDARDDIAVLGLAFGDDQLDVLVRVPGCLQACLRDAHQLRTGARGGRGVDLDHFLVDGAQSGALRARIGRAGGAGEGKRGEQDKDGGD